MTSGSEHQQQSRIRVFIEDHTGNKTREARIAAYAEISELVPALVTALSLPVTDLSGRAITYHLAYDNRQLQMDETLESAQVSEGAVLTLVPEMTSTPTDNKETPPNPKTTLKRQAYILHISDLHLQKDEDAYNWYYQLAEDLEELEIDHLDAVVISGDITNHATREEYNAAQVFINKIRDFPISSERIVIAPGNHDVNWKQGREGYQLFWKQDFPEAIKTGEFEEYQAKKHIEYEDIIALRHRAFYQKRFLNFKEFYDRIKSDQQYTLDYEQQYTLCICQEQKILIVGFNSAWELDQYYRTRASINFTAMTNAIRRIKENGGYSDYLKIAVWHHPLQSPFEDCIKEHKFMERLAQAGFRLALHGHIHKAEKSLYSYDHKVDGYRRINLVAARTFGAPIREWIPGYPLQYNLLKIEGDQLTVNTRRRESYTEPWKPDARWMQGQSNNPLPYYTIDLS